VTTALGRRSHVALVAIGVVGVVLGMRVAGVWGATHRCYPGQLSVHPREVSAGDTVTVEGSVTCNRRTHPRSTYVIELYLPGNPEGPNVNPQILDRRDAAIGRDGAFVVSLRIPAGTAVGRAGIDYADGQLSMGCDKYAKCAGASTGISIKPT
jgi:hypothetical protein